MINIFAELFAFLNQSPLGSILVILYFVLVLGDRAGRELFFDRTWYLITSPQRFEIYNESWFKSVEEGLKSLFLHKEILRSLEMLQHYLIGMIASWKKLTGWLFLGISLAIFITANIFTINNIADLLGLMVNIPISNVFDYGFAITAGTFFTIITAGFVLFETTGESEFSDYSSVTYKEIKFLFKATSIFLLISSIMIILFFGLRAFAFTTVLSDSMNMFINNLSQLGSNLLIPLNSFLITALIFPEAIKALQSLFSLLVLLIFIFLSVFYFISILISSLLRLTLDILFRFLVWLFWALSFSLFAPLDKIVSAPSRLIELFFDGNKK